jgi:hypothetical protein
MNDFSEKPTAFKGPFSKAYVNLSTSTRQTPIAELPPPIQEEIPISQLPLAGGLFGDEMVAVVQNGITCRSTAAAVSGSGMGPTNLTRVASLIYPATVGQSVFPLSEPDYYDNTYVLLGGDVLQVTVGGLRLAPDDGTGFGGYTVDVADNQIVLVTPFGMDQVVIVGAGDLVIIDVSVPTGVAPAPPTSSNNFAMDALSIVALNVIPNLSHVPSGGLMQIIVNGRVFCPVGEQPPFSYSGVQITWLSTIWAVVPGDEVVAVYSRAG